MNMEGIREVETKQYLKIFTRKCISVAAVYKKWPNRLGQAYHVEWAVAAR